MMALSAVIGWAWAERSHGASQREPPLVVGGQWFQKGRISTFSYRGREWAVTRAPQGPIAFAERCSDGCPQTTYALGESEGLTCGPCGMTVPWNRLDTATCAPMLIPLTRGWGGWEVQPAALEGALGLRPAPGRLAVQPLVRLSGR